MNDDGVPLYLSAFKPFFFWRVKVAYRAKNAIGTLVRTTAHVKFDKELTKIEEFKPAEE